MTDASPLTLPPPPRPQCRKAIVYVPTDLDAVAVLALLGFGAVARLTTPETEAVLAMAQIAKMAAGDTSTRPLTVNSMRCAQDGRLAVVFPSEPRCVIVEAGPAATVPILVIPHPTN